MITKQDTTPKKIEDLSLEQKKEIESVYADDNTVAKTAKVVGIRYKIVAAWLRHRCLTRSPSHYAKRSHWRGLTRASFEARKARLREYGYDV